MRTRGAILIVAVLALAPGLPVSAQVTVQAAVESAQVTPGQPFQFQIQVNGSDQVQQPDVSALDQDFTVQFLGGHNNSSHSVQIVNGQMTQQTIRQFILAYRLIAKRAGVLTIPAIKVMVDGAEYTTMPIQLNGTAPRQTNDFRFELTLERPRVYVGEPVLLTAKWWLGYNAQNPIVAIPALEDRRIDVLEPSVNRAQNRQYIRLPLSNGEAIAEQTQENVDGRTFLALTFQKVLVPREPGVYEFPEATAACEAIIGQQRQRRTGGLLDDFFNPLGQTTTKNFVAASNPLRLDVLPLPEDGKPANFSGLVGEVRIRTTAAPADVNIGDPITLTVWISGPPNLDRVQMPNLKQIPAFAERFKIPDEMAPPVIEGVAKVFTQTIRAQKAGPTFVPPIEISHFNPATGAYAIASSQPIPITVRETKVLTAEDIEGGQLAPQALRNELTAHREGIAHNYTDASVLVNQAYGLGTWASSPGWLALVGLPPLGYASLAVFLFLRRRDLANPSLRRSKRALAAGLAALDNVRGPAVHDGILDAVRAYLGARLDLPPGALTFADVKTALANRGVDAAVLDELKGVFDACEAHRYAGGSASADAGELVTRARTLLNTLERSIKR